MGTFQLPLGADGWHEDHLIISALQSGTTLKNEVWEVVHSRQTTKMEKFSSPPHSKQNYRCRIKSLIEQGIIYEVRNELALTSLGKWVAKFKVTKPTRKAWFC